jgi:tRNA (guanine26-N2/guanine27-N2)-dimethyltransferase
VKEHQEGRAIFKANLSGKDKGPGKAKGVFYNPAMEMSRDLHVAFAKELEIEGIVLDGLAASGIRGIRLILEAGLNVEFCDTSTLATNTIAENLKLNGIESTIYNKPVEELLQEKKYDCIDIDPFGTPAPFLEAALKGLNDNGILGVSATDTAVLCGAKPSICMKRYGANSMKKVAAKEIGIRIMLSKMHSMASEIGKGIQPLLCYSEGHHLRVFVKLTKKNNVELKWINTDMEIVEEEEYGAGGPLWIDKIIEKELVPSNYEGKLGKFFEILSEEANGPPGLYDINDIARIAEIGQTPQRNKIVKCLKELGHFASSSIFSPLGIKTTASKIERTKAIKLAQSL